MKLWVWLSGSVKLKGNSTHLHIEVCLQISRSSTAYGEKSSIKLFKATKDFILRFNPELPFKVSTYAISCEQMSHYSRRVSDQNEFERHSHSKYTASLKATRQKQ